MNNNKLNIIKFNFTIGKLVSKELIEHHHIHFDEQVSFLEDLLFYLEYIKHIDDFSVSSATGYNYVICNSGSLSYKLYPAEKRVPYLSYAIAEVREIKTIHKLEDAHIDNLMRSAEQYILRVCRSLYYYPYRKQRTLRINYLKQYFYVKSFGK